MSRAREKYAGDEEGEANGKNCTRTVFEIQNLHTVHACEDSVHAVGIANVDFIGENRAEDDNFLTRVFHFAIHGAIRELAWRLTVPILAPLVQKRLCQLDKYETRVYEIRSLSVIVLHWNQASMRLKLD